MQDEAIAWLVQGDVAVQYLTHKFLLNSNAKELDVLQKRIEQEGFGNRLISLQTDSGHWGRWYYQPKWTCTHYTLYTLKQLGIRPTVAACRQMTLRAFDECMLACGGMNFAKSLKPSDSAVDGMFLDYAVYFCPEEQRIEQLVAYLLSQRKPQGGYSWNPDTTIGDPHTTICVIEGFLSYLDSGMRTYTHSVTTAISDAIQFIVRHALFADTDKRYRKLTYPHYYRYDILRFLEDAAKFQYPFDVRIQDAVVWLRKKQRASLWPLEYSHPGAVHFHFEQLHEPSRFITMKALYVCNYFENLKEQT